MQSLEKEDLLAGSTPRNGGPLPPPVTFVYQPGHKGIETFLAGFCSPMGCGVLYFPMTKFPNLVPAECFDERHLPSLCQECLCSQIVSCLVKGVCCQPWLSWWAGAVRRGEDRPGRTIAKGDRGHEVFQEEI